jgi:hypothetical protein
MVARSIDARLKIDLLTAAQNQRLTFETGDGGQISGLSLEEQQAVEEVLNRHRAIPHDRTQVLFIGNSQTVALMDRAPGDLTTPQWLEVMLRRGNALGAIRLGSLANLSMTEMAVQLLTFGEPNSATRQFDAVVLSLSLEEFRGVGIRQKMQDLSQSAEMRTSLQRVLAANPDLIAARQAFAELLTAPPASAADRSVSGEPEQRPNWTERSDERLAAAVTERLPMLEKREQFTGLVGMVFMGVRNRALGITSASPRPVSAATYKAGVEVLQLILRYAQSHDVPVLVYLAPVRPIQPNPFLPADVERFRSDVPKVCARYSATVVDCTDVVPEALWTNFPNADRAGERDFAHFTGAAHKLVAETIFPQVRSLAQRAREGHAARREIPAR